MSDRKTRSTFPEFIERIPHLDIIQKYSSRTNTCAGVTVDDLTFLPYQVLKHEVTELLESTHFEQVIYTILKHKEKSLKFITVEEEDNYIKTRFLFWIQDQYKLIAELEQKYLSTPPKPKLIAAGIRDLDILGDVNLIDSLAGGDILKWNRIRKLPYSMIFDKQLKQTIEGRINDKMEEQSKKPGKR